MEFIRTLREKQHISRQNDISDQAHSLICLDDFEGRTLTGQVDREFQ